MVALLTLVAVLAGYIGVFCLFGMAVNGGQNKWGGRLGIAGVVLILTCFFVIQKANKLQRDEWAAAATPTTEKTPK